MNIMDSLTSSIIDNTPIRTPEGVTIVSAFMSQINARGDRPVQKYIDLGKALLSLHIRQVVFIERHIYETYIRSEYAHLCYGYGIRFFTYAGRAYEYVVLGHLTFVFFERADMYLEYYRDMATEFSLNTPHPSKDTLDYMFVQCHKTEWVAMAISLDNNTGNGIYSWLDFGIRHMYPSAMAFDMAIYKLHDRLTKKSILKTVEHSSSSTSNDVVYAPSCWEPNKQYTQDVYREVFWVFSGSAFGGHSKALIDFALRTKTKCIDILTTRRRLMWEVNVWYLVYCDCPELFSLFYGNHNANILTNWK